MKTIGVLFLAIGALAFTVRIQGRAKVADDETQLIQLERSWNQAEMARDARALASLIDETLVYVDYDGSLMNKAAYLRSQRGGSLGRLSRNGQYQGKTVHPARALHGHLDQADRSMEMRRQSEHAHSVALESQK